MPAKRRRKHARRSNLRLAFIFALIGGILLIVQGFAGGVGIVGFALAELQAILPQYAGIIGVALLILTAIASLGGIVVIFGGFLILHERLTTGKFLIGLGAGFGIISLLVALAWFYYLGGGMGAFVLAIFASGQVIGFLGILLSILARLYARK